MRDISEIDLGFAGSRSAKTPGVIDRQSAAGLRVVSSREGRLARVTLNHPSSRQVLDWEMVTALERALTRWVDDPNIEFVLIDHAESKLGFCYGHDFEHLMHMVRRPGRDTHSYLEASYQLCNFIARYPKPIVVVANGVATGSGLGIVQNATYRIATERTIFALPDTTYGFIPDFGAAHYLAKLRGELGAWLALTGGQVTGPQNFETGLATHYCLSEHLPSLKQDLAKQGLSALKEFDHPEIRRDFSRTSLISRLGLIDYLFAGSDLNEILRRLQRGGDWARTQARKLSAKSPLSSKIALRLVRTGAIIDSAEVALKIEFRIAARLIQTRDFREGVRAAFSDKDHCPKWSAPSIYATKVDEVGRFFTPLTSNELDLSAPLGRRDKLPV